MALSRDLAIFGIVLLTRRRAVNQEIIENGMNINNNIVKRHRN